MTKTYYVNEIFCSLQGEGLRVGTLNVFVRFAGCNLACSKDGEAGFDCDTEFSSRRAISLDELKDTIERLWYPDNATRYAWTARPAVILTGGEPLLQVDDDLVRHLLTFCAVVAVETNGTHPLPQALADDDGRIWISCSPKSAEHTLRCGYADEVRYVRHEGQGIPKPSLSSEHRFVSPAWSDDQAQTKRNLEWCMKLVHENPTWRLSVQQHKLWGVR